MKKAKLTKRQESFINEYLQCKNASEAARRAGYSKKSAASIGSENLRKPEISSEINARFASACMSADEVLARLSDFARADMREFVIVDKQGNPIGFDLRPGKPLYLIKKASVTDKGVTVELHDAQTALVKIGERHRLFVQRSEVSVTDAVIELTWNDKNNDASLAQGTNTSQEQPGAIQSPGGGETLGEKSPGGGLVPG